VGSLQAVLGHKDARSTQIYVQGVSGLNQGALGLSIDRR
jgi:hypothetical protein